MIYLVASFLVEFIMIKLVFHCRRRCALKGLLKPQFELSLIFRELEMAWVEAEVLHDFIHCVIVFVAYDFVLKSFLGVPNGRDIAALFVQYFTIAQILLHMLLQLRHWTAWHMFLLFVLRNFHNFCLSIWNIILIFLNYLSHNLLLNISLLQTATRRVTLPDQRLQIVWPIDFVLSIFCC